VQVDPIWIDRQKVLDKAMITWTVSLDKDSFDRFGLNLDQYKSDLTTDIQFAGKEWDKYFIAGQDQESVSMDVRVVVDNSIESALWVPSNTVDIEGNVQKSYVAYEIETGKDQNGSSPDLEIHVNPNALVDQVNNPLGANVWFDPGPNNRSSQVPPDKVDAVSALTHEIGHGLAFYGKNSGTFKSPFDSHILKDGGAWFFDGENANFVYGGRVPLQENAYHLSDAHITREMLLANPGLNTDLMLGEAFARGRHYEVTNLDLAILADCGVKVDAPLTKAASSVIQVGLSQRYPLDQWFSARDPDAETISIYKLRDDNADPNSGQFIKPDGEAAKANEDLIISTSDFHNSWFQSGATPTSDNLSVAAWDGHEWGPWAHLTATTWASLGQYQGAGAATSWFSHTPPPAPTIVSSGSNLLQNGSLEQGTNPGNYSSLTSGSKDISGWEVIRGGTDYVGTDWVSSDGQRSFHLNGTPDVGGVAQTFTTTPGQKYHVSFDLAGHYSGLMQDLGVSAAGQSTTVSFQAGTNPKDLGWQEKIWEFTATDTQTKLEFYSLQKGYLYGGPSLDDVVVMTSNASPIPSQRPTTSEIPFVELGGIPGSVARLPPFDGGHDNDIYTHDLAFPGIHDTGEWFFM
jgi:choice-of-anchor C domain-containing protein